MLTKKRSEITVTVSGPNVVDSSQRTNKKNRSFCERRCDIIGYSSTPLEWHVAAGTQCGIAGPSFDAYDENGNLVGIADLKVINKDC